MPNEQGLGATAASNALVNHSIEITPQQLNGDLANLAAKLPLRTDVFVPFLPRAAFGATVRACEHLSRLGMVPVPHVAARAFHSESDLDRALAQLRQAGADTLFLIAGDIDQPTGPYRSSLDVMDTGLIDSHGFSRLGFAAYPQTHPKLPRAELDHWFTAKLAQAQTMKARCFVVTQFCFAIDPVAQWLNHPAVHACALPIRIGVPGPARVRALLAYALQCGVTASFKTLSGRADARSAWLAGWTPDAFVESLLEFSGSQKPTMDIGLHWFAFGGLEPTLNSLKRWQARSIDKQSALTQ